MHPPSAPSSALPYAALSASPLFIDYCTRFGRVASFYAGDFRRPDHLEAALQQAIDIPRSRDPLVDALEAQNRRWGLDDAGSQALDTLRRPDAGVVITGQQLGLFVSPLYTIYKTLTTIQLARHLSRTTGRPVVPVFWLAGEDHDFEEIGSTILAGHAGLSDLAYPAPPQRGPVGRLLLTEAITPLIDQVEQLLPRTDVTPALIRLLSSCYEPGVSMEDAFARLLKQLLPDTGLLLVSIDDPALKQLARPLFEREIRDHGTSSRLLAETSAALTQQGYHAQVTTRPTNLFWMEDHARLPIDAEDGRFVLRGSGRHFSEAELLTINRETPERLSPNVVLRPILQDLLFPTAAYVAGPGETAYFAQYRALYDWAGVPMPIIYPRVSLTILDSYARKNLDRYPFTIPEYAEGVEKLLKRTATSTMPAEYEAVYTRTRAEIKNQLSALQREAGRIDPTLERSAEATRTRLNRLLDRLHDRIVRGQKRTMDLDRERIGRLVDGLFPHGKLQERALAPLHLLNAHGLDVFAGMLDRLPLDTWEHHVVAL